jgi:hypothetical protein
MQDIYDLETYNEHFKYAKNPMELTVFIDSENLLNPLIKNIYVGNIKQTCKNLFYRDVLNKAPTNLPTGYHLKQIIKNDKTLHIYHVGNELQLGDGSGHHIVSTTRYRGINFSAYDMGSLSGRQDSSEGGYGGECTDEFTNNKGSTGGWLQYTEDMSSSIKNAPSTNYDANWILQSKPGQVANPFIVGGGGETWSNADSGWNTRWNETDFKMPWNKGSATSSPVIDADNPTNSDSSYSTSFPDPRQIKLACQAGVNIIRLPFMPTFIYELAHTSWPIKGVSDENGMLYAPPNKNYFKWYMQTVDYIRTNHPDVVIIIDCHVYQRWCPLNIPGTVGCLEPLQAGIYDMSNQNTSDCPYNANFTGAKPSYEKVISQCKSGKEDSWKRIIGIDCMETLWDRLLGLNTHLGERTLAKYLHDNDQNIWVELMNEPNQVYSEDVGRGYGKVIKTMQKNQINNKILIGGNYWSGIHAQIDPSENGTKWNSIYTPASSDQGSQRTTLPPADALLYGISNELGLNNMNSLIKSQQLVYTVHQYMDINSTGLWGCTDANTHFIKTVDNMKVFTRYDKLKDWALTKGIKLFVSEVGAVPLYGNGHSTGCIQRLNLFLEMIEQDDNVLGWTLWRGVPNVSWAFTNQKVSPTWADGEDSTAVNSWSNRVFWDKPSFCSKSSKQCNGSVFTNNINTKAHKRQSAMADTGGLWKLGGGSSTAFYDRPT